MNDDLPFICFAIPTWNRCRQLERTVATIAEQIIESNVAGRIFISDNASTDDTQGVVKNLQSKYPFVDYHLRDVHGDYAVNFRTVFSHAKGRYCWLFGDDDVLLPGALQLLVSQIQAHPVSFYHCSLDYRVSGQERSKKGKFFDLCNHVGLLELAGFLSSCVVRGDLLRKASELESSDLYQKNAFYHTCALLEVVSGEDAMLIDRKMVAAQDNQQTEETLARWANGNTAFRYMLVVDAVSDMVKRKIIPPKMRASFFRYHKFHLWDRFLSGLLAEYFHNPREFSATIWEKTRALADCIESPEEAKMVRVTVDAVRAKLSAHWRMRADLAQQQNEIASMHDILVAEIYPIRMFP